MTAPLSKTGFTFEEVQRLASEYHTPIEDALLIAVNLYGIASDPPRHRALHMTIVDCFTPEAKLSRTGLVHQRALAATLNRPLETC